MRRTGLSVVLLLLASLFAACGGGDDGPSDAFCDDLDTLSDQIADGDDIDDQIDTIENDLGESAADGEERDAVENVADAYGDDDNDQADLAEAVQDELGDFADDCELEDFAIAPTTTTTSTTDTTDVPETEATDTTLPPEEEGTSIEAREPVPGNIAAEFADLANACFNGDMEGCDTLFDTTPVDSPDEAYGETCGGRVAEADIQPSECATLITGPVEVPAEIVDQANAQACFGGDMAACDTLFNTSEADSLDELYGALCGGRVSATQAFCVDIFGDVAFL